MQICDYFKPKKAKMTIRFLPLLLLPLIGISQTNSQVEMPINGNTVSEKQPLEIKRNALYNLEEIKVRWKKAALENCSGVPCVVAPPAPSFICGTNTVSDYDGNPYNTVLIDNQCWTRENLKVTKYNDGTDIPNVTNGSAWATLNTGARAVYEVSGTPVSSYVGTYGYLYNWYAVNDSKKICPTGWHVPSTAEWSLLIDYMSGWLVAGDKMKSTGDNVAGTGLWVPTNTGTDFYGFTAHPGGYRYQNGDFYNINRDAKFWSTTENSVTSKANTLEISNFGPNAYSDNKLKVSGLSVRCLKDL